MARRQYRTLGIVVSPDTYNDIIQLAKDSGVTVSTFLKSRLEIFSSERKDESSLDEESIGRFTNLSPSDPNLVEERGKKVEPLAVQLDVITNSNIRWTQSVLDAVPFLPFGRTTRTPVLLKHEDICVLKGICGSEAADPPSHNYHVDPFSRGF